MVRIIALGDKDKYCERVTANLKIAKPSNQYQRVFGRGLFPFAEGYLVLARVIVLEQVGLEAKARITSHSGSKNNMSIKTAPHSVWSRVISIFVICEGLFGLGKGFHLGASIGKDFCQSQVTAILKITQWLK